ncbi:MAG: ABC transporter substrate-binding protein, partial [Anaerolineae bacterium]
WAGSGTLFLLRHLARQMQRARVMIVATYRQVELDAARPLHEVLLDLQRERLATRLNLPRLDREETRQLLAILHDEEITPEYLAGIYTETEGNPFFIEEVCKALVGSGKLYFQDGRWHRPSMEELGVPQSVRVAIQSRLNVLPAETQETLRLAAILGREFEFDILTEASDQDEEVLIEALEDSERALLIEKVSAEAGGTFALVHGLIASTLIESTRTLQRRQLHRRAAAAIEARRPDDRSRLEALAYHYSEAGEGEKAASYLLQAGDQARVLYAHREAIDYYQQALHYLQEQAARSEEPERDLRRAARTLMKLGLTYHNAYEFRASRQAYEEGFALWQRAEEAEPAVPPPPAPHALRGKTVHPIRILDPTMADAGSAVAVMQLFSGLVELAPEMDVVPGVARSWEVSEGGRKYVFHLRNDGRWSDGAPVTAGDFAYAWKRLLDPATGSPYADLLYDIKGARAFHRGEGERGDVEVRALDEVTLAVELEEPTGYWLHLLTGSFTCPLPRHVVEAHGKTWTEEGHLVTNGPFRLESWQPGRSMVLSRNPGYRGRFPGNIQRVEGSSQVDPLAPGEAGSVDIIFGFRLVKTIDSALRQQHGEIYVTKPALATDYLGLNLSLPPFDDPRVRRAFALAIDRETLSHEDQWGNIPATGGFIPPGMPGHSAGIGLPYDPDGARQLLAQAGYPEGSGFPVIDSRATPGNALKCTYLQEQWREVLGVEIAWNIVEPDKFFDLLDREPPHMFLATSLADYPDPDSFLRSSFRRQTRWRDEVYDGLVAAARGAMDQEKRLKLYQQADRILVEEAPLVPLLYGCWHWLQKPWVRKLATAPMAVWHYKDFILEPH